MTTGSLAALTVIFFVTSLVTVVTGSTSLITIPVMLQYGMEPRTAVATNMFALVLLSLGGALPFARTPAMDRPRLPLQTGLTLAGSGIGALLLFAVPARWMTLIIPAAMIAVLILLLIEPGSESLTESAPSPGRVRAGYAVTALLAIYGGFLSGGYATLVTASGMLFFHYPFPRAMAMSKVLNTASSLIAVAVFAWYRVVDWPLGLLLGAVAFAGGLTGSRWARHMPARLLRHLFLLAVAALAAKGLIFDVPWRAL